ncbi:MAG TPA: J domain-containing protein [Candidatus Limnocylindrales bacterium]|nr:J domain-containing protein [Candidatus Limnocylindrales bacterium]
MPGPTLPADDLYARLELPATATPEAIEIAWRSLLRRHHPDVAGPTGLERAKRINVAHDWLSDPDLRARYDRERGVGSVEAGRGPTRRDSRPGDRSPAPPARARPRRPVDQVSAFLDRIGRLTIDDLDRLALADPAPIAFGATIRRFLPDELRVALEAIELEVDRRLPNDAAARPGIRDTLHAYAAELVLGPFLDELLSEPFRARARERLSRGWEAAVDQPRYGPNGHAVRALIARLRTLDADGVTALARSGGRVQPREEPWPPGASPDDDEGLRVSSVLAARDAAAAVRSGDLGPAAVARARRAAGRIAHLLVLRHAFAPAAFDELTAAWRPRLLPDEPLAPRVRRPRRA